MSYPRAWTLVEAVDLALGAPAVAARAGRPPRRRGGADRRGPALIARYREVEAAAQRQAGPPPPPRGTARAGAPAERESWRRLPAINAWL